MNLKDLKISKNFKILGVLIGISIISFALANQYALPAFAASMDANTKCHGNDVLVFRTHHKDYLCIDRGTAATWQSHNMAQIVTASEGGHREQCKGGMVYMDDPYGDTTICVNQSKVAKMASSGWVARPYDAAAIPATFDTTTSCKSGQIVFQKTDADKSDRTGGIAGDIICVKQVDAYKFEGSANYERISDEPNYDVATPMCSDRYQLMINDETSEEFCIRADKMTAAKAQGLTTVGDSPYSKISGAGSSDCKVGLVKMSNPNNDVVICVNQDTVPKRAALGWVAIDFTPGPSATDTSEIQCKGGKAVLRAPGTGVILCSNQDQAQKYIRQGYERIDKQEKQTATGTIQSEQEGGRNHESHQIARLLVPENTVKVGVITYTASEAVQVTTLQGPLRSGENSGQPVWSPDGQKNFAFTESGEAKTSGTYEFAGQALALHTMNASPFQATYTISYHSLPAGEYSEGVVDFGTMKSGPDPGVGHESHSLAILLAPSDTPYHDGVLTYAASEPVQMVVLHGPLGPGEDVGQPTWSPDGETKFGLTFVDDNLTSGSFEFTGNAVAAHTMNTDGFTITYSLATRR